MRIIPLTLIAGSMVMAAAPEETAFQVPAGDLAGALRVFEVQAGLRVRAKDALLRGLRSPGVQGRHSRPAALALLLKGTGLVASGQGGGFELRPGARPGNPAEPEGAPGEVTLAPVVVKGRVPLVAGRQVFTEQTIKQLPSANHSLSELVANNPAVRLSSSAGGSLNRGSMAEEDISIHGANPYQNLYQLDGLNGTNNLNPANHNSNLQVGNVPSHSQAYFVDTALLGEVRVFDSNIPVEYGHFNGGVIDARIKRATGHDEVRLGYRTSHSGLSEQKVSQGFEQQYQAGASGYTPEWRKDFYNLSADRMLTDQLGMVVGLSRRASTIQRDTYEGRGGEQDRVDNGLAKFSWWAGNGAISDLTVKYAKRSEENANTTYRNTRWTNEHAAFGLAWGFEQKTAAGKFTTQVGWDRFADHRDSSASEFITYRVVNPASTVTEGGFGKEETARDTWTVKARFDFNPVKSGAVVHHPYAGLEADWVNAGFDRKQDAYSYQLYRTTPTATAQKRSMNLYRQGTVDVDYQDLALFVADRMTWGRFTLVPGLRLDRETFLHNSNVAPRVSGEWDVLGNRKTLVKLGTSRYYGDGILNLALTVGKNGLKQAQTSSTGVPVTTPTAPVLSKFESLRTPFDDEYALSLTQELGGLRGVFSYVRREERDGINAKTIPGGTEYNNLGRATTDSVGITLQNRRAWSLLAAEWAGSLTLDYLHARRNQDLTDSYDQPVDEGKIYYNGRLIDSSSRPSADFNQPWRLALQLNGQWRSLGLGWNNQVRWLGSRPEAFYLGRNPKDGYEIYEDKRVAAYWTLDSSFTYQPRFLPSLELRLEVNNVLNKMAVLVPTSPLISSNRDTYANGREIWMQFSFTF